MHNDPRRQADADGGIIFSVAEAQSGKRKDAIGKGAEVCKAFSDLANCTYRTAAQSFRFSRNDKVLQDNRTIRYRINKRIQWIMCKAGIVEFTDVPNTPTVPTKQEKYWR